jgi:hypothetical protein
LIEKKSALWYGSGCKNSNASHFSIALQQLRGKKIGLFSKDDVAEKEA